MNIQQKMNQLMLRIKIFRMEELTDELLKNCVNGEYNEHILSYILSGLKFSKVEDLEILQQYINNFIDRICDIIENYTYSEKEKNMFKNFLYINYLIEDGNAVGIDLNLMEEALSNTFNINTTAWYCWNKLFYRFIAIQNIEIDTEEKAQKYKTLLDLATNYIPNYRTYQEQLSQIIVTGYTGITIEYDYK